MNINAIKLFFIAYLFLLSPADAGSIKLDLTSCRPASAEQISNLSPLWTSWLSVTKACPLYNQKHQLTLYVVAIDINLRDKIPPATILNAALIDPRNHYIGNLSTIVPQEKPWGEDIKFSHWINDFPHQVDIHNYDPRPEGETDELPSVWDEKTNRFEIPIDEHADSKWTMGMDLQERFGVYIKKYVEYFGKDSDYKKWISNQKLYGDSPFIDYLVTDNEVFETIYIRSPPGQPSSSLPEPVLVEPFPSGESYSAFQGRKLILGRIPAGFPTNPERDLDIVLTQWRNDWPQRLDLYARHPRHFLGSMLWNPQKNLYEIRRD